MCKRTIQTTLALALGIAASAWAGPVLLSSYSEISSGGRAPWSDPRIQIELGLTSPMTGQGAHIGSGVFWSQGQTGIFDFSASNSVGFPLFEQLATNGIENQGGISALWSAGGGGGHGIKDSVLFDRFPPIGRPPDLVGYDLDFIRLIVNRLDFTPWMPERGLEGLYYSYDITIEAYGNLVPESTTVMLLLMGLAFSRRCLSKREWQGGIPWVAGPSAASPYR